MDLFDFHEETGPAKQGRDEGAKPPGREPLAERMRPRTLEEYIGQSHLLGPGRTLRLILDSGHLPSLILWGPPGCGKSSLARILASRFGYDFHYFSAVTSGIRELKDLFARLEAETRARNLVFIDEIHRFNKAQQDAFLPYVEKGVITLVGTTTLNPSFSIVSPLLSRSRVLILNTLEEAEILEVMSRALKDAQRGYGALEIESEAGVLETIARYSQGDCRTALNVLELLVESSRGAPPAHPEAAGAASPGPGGARETGPAVPILLTREKLEAVFQGRLPDYDRDGEGHYNLISALHKSIRGSDADASLYWLARMLEGGEDPLYIARRLMRVASEDVGLADPQALVVAHSAQEAVHFLGMPEGDLALAEAVVYLATAPKSNELYTAYSKAKEDAHEYSADPVPLYLRNPSTSLMKKAGYGEGYLYPHDFPGRLVDQQYFPPRLEGRRYYTPSEFGYEKIVEKRMRWWEERRKGTGK
jgi:putative ATPase